MKPLEEVIQQNKQNLSTMHIMDNDYATVVSIDIGKTEICEESTFTTKHSRNIRKTNNNPWAAFKVDRFELHSNEVDDDPFPDSDIKEDFDKTNNKTKKV